MSLKFISLFSDGYSLTVNYCGQFRKCMGYVVYIAAGVGSGVVAMVTPHVPTPFVRPIACP